MLSPSSHSMTSSLTPLTMSPQGTVYRGEELYEPLANKFFFCEILRIQTLIWVQIPHQNFTLCSIQLTSRYLLSDGCVLLRKPLVSGSALRFEGQLTVYGWRGGPCYRCLFPSPPPSATVTNCSEGGVLGVGKVNYNEKVEDYCASVPGVIGSLQALEVLKIASGMERILRPHPLINIPMWYP